MGFLKKKNDDISYNMSTEENNSENDIYKDFVPPKEEKKKEKKIKESANETVEQEENNEYENIYKDYIHEEEKAPETSEDVTTEIKTDNANISKVVYHEKENDDSFLESHTKLTKATKMNKMLLLGFYLIVVIIGVVVFFMIMTDKYQFYFKDDQVVIKNGSSYQIELTPKNAGSFDYLNYRYKIADERVATVDEFGTIKAVGIGSTDLKVSMKYGLVSKKIRVVSDNLEISGIVLKVQRKDKMQMVSSVNMETNETLTLHAFDSSRDDINLTVNYSSSDSSVAIVDEFGNVTAKRNGTAVITGSLDGYSGNITIHVSNTESSSKPESTPVTSPTTKPSVTPVATPVVVKSISFMQNSVSLKKGGSLQLAVAISPSDASVNGLEWSSNSSNVTVNGNGRITGKEVGTAVITVKTSNGKKATCTVNVINETINVKSVALNSSNISLKVGNAFQLVATISPSNATERDLTWSSSNPKVATVNNNGLISGLTTGETTITVRTKDGNKTATCTVNVITSTSSTSKLAGVDIGIVQTTKYVGDTLQLRAKLTPSNAKVRKITWISSDPSVASVSSEGLVTTKKVGTATITVTADDYTSSGTIIVKNKS